MDEPTVIAGAGASGPATTAASGDDTGDAGGAHLDPVDVGPTALAVVPASHYQRGAEHARGGLGVVLRGRDRRLDRPVAIKELLRGTAINRARFAREARITARLQHPGIVPIYEAGTWPDGQPFYAMRMVEGRTLSAAIADCTTVADRIALLSRVLVVAETMAYAHSQGVIHRDLKPSNVLVGDYGETVVIDWGIAKQIGEADDDAEVATAAVVPVDLTIAGQVMGTPWYMAPEQARGEAVDRPADVYALGAILYHVLAGAPPHVETPQVIEALAARIPPPPLSSRAPELPADLVAVVDKALATDPGDRYPSAAELAADLKRFLAGQRVSVHRYGAGALIARWVGRHRAAVAIAAAALVALIVGGAVSVTNIVSARDDARDKATALAAQRDSLILTQAESALDRDPTATLAWLKTYPATGREWNRVRSLAADAVSRGVARHVLGHGEEAYGIALSGDGSTVATTSENHLRIWDTATGALRAVHDLRDGRQVAVSRDGRLVAAFRDHDRTILAWRDGAPEPVRLSGHRDILAGLALTRDERRVVSTGSDGTVRAWTTDGTSLLALEGARQAFAREVVVDDNHVASIDRDGRARITAIDSGETRMLGTISGEPRTVAVTSHTLAVGGSDGVWIWDLRSGGERRLASNVAVTALRHAGDDTLVAIAADQSLRIWRLSDGHETHLPHDRPIRVVATSASGAVASGEDDGAVHVWRPGPAAGEYQALTLLGHRRAVSDLAFADDGLRLASISLDYDARLWDLPAPATAVRRADTRDLFQLAYAHGGTELVVTSRSGAVRSVHADGTARLLGTHGAIAYALAVALDGELVASAAWDGSIRLWERGAQRVVREAGATLWSVALSPDGRFIAAAGDDGAFLGAVGATPAPLAGHDGRVTAVAFSPDGTTLASTGADATVRLWDVASRASRHVLRGHHAETTRPTFSADGSVLATGARDGEVRVWNPITGDGRVIGRHQGPVRAVALSPDGQWVVSGGRDRTVRLWGLVSGAHVVLGAHASEVRDVAFSPDGKTVASASFDRSVRLWDLASRSSEPFRGAGIYHRVAFRPDGGELAATCEDGTLLLVPLPSPTAPPTEPGAIRAWLDQKTTGTELDAD